MLHFRDPVLSALNNATTNGSAIPADNILQVSVQVVSTGTPTGVVKLQYSNDPNQGLVNDSNYSLVPVHWSDIPSASVAVNAAGVFSIPITTICYGFIRAVYTDGSGGAGTGTTSVNMKSNGPAV